MRSVVLETKKVTGSHTAENVKNSLIETQNIWNEKDEKAAKKLRLKKEKGIDDNELNEMQREPELHEPELPRMITEVESEDVDGPSKAKNLNAGDCDEFLQDIVCWGIC